MATKKISVKVVIFLLVLMILISVTLYYNLTIAPFVVNLAEAEVKQTAINTLVEGALKLKNYETFYNEFYEYEKNAEGDIVLIRANTAKINLMTIYAQKELQKSLNSLKKDKISIPAGAFTGSSWLADKGNGIELNVIPIGTIETKINSYYYNEGINQTLHRLVLKTTATVRLLVPIRAKDVTISTEFLLAEDVLAGRVPESYVTGISDDNIYDLLP